MITCTTDTSDSVKKPIFEKPKEIHFQVPNLNKEKELKSDESVEEIGLSDFKTGEREEDVERDSKDVVLEISDESEGGK